MIKRAAKLPVLIIATGLMVGCASQSDFDKLQADVDAMKSDVAYAKRTAEEALAATKSTQQNQMFRKSMQK